MTTTLVVASIADDLRNLANELDTVALDTDEFGVAKGTIVKAKPNQVRFKPKSIWVYIGNGEYKHLTGKKGLIAKHDRLSGYVNTVYIP